MPCAELSNTKVAESAEHVKESAGYAGNLLPPGLVGKSLMAASSASTTGDMGGTERWRYHGRVEQEGQCPGFPG